MRRARAAIGLGLGAVIGVTTAAWGCRSDHNVSPWPEGMTVADFALAPDLDANLRRVDEEMAHENLALLQQEKGKLRDGEEMIVRGYCSRDILEGQRCAVRAITPYGVVIAIGPQARGDKRRIRSRLLPALVLEGAWKSGTDWTGDGCPDVTIVGSDGSWEVWCVEARGAAAYEIRGIVPATMAMDVDGDGRPELVGVIRQTESDALDVTLLEVMAFDGRSFRFDADKARVYHQGEAQRHCATGVGDDAGVPREQDAMGDAVRCAWHSIRGAANPKQALDAADRTAMQRAPLGAGVSQSWIRWRGWLGALGQ